MIMQAMLYWSSLMTQWLMSIDFPPPVWHFVGYTYQAVSVLAAVLPASPDLPYEALGNVITVMSGVYITLTSISIVYFLIRITGLVKD